MSDNDSKIYVDASLPATLRNGVSAIRCPTLQEAVIAWYQLPEAERERATILVDGKTAYTASEIVRLHYRFENHDDSTQASDWEPLESDRGSVAETPTIPGTAAISGERAGVSRFPKTQHSSCRYGERGRRSRWSYVSTHIRRRRDRQNLA